MRPALNCIMLVNIVALVCKVGLLTVLGPGVLSEIQILVGLFALRRKKTLDMNFYSIHNIILKLLRHFKM
jgi:hypothetical protein